MNPSRWINSPWEVPGELELEQEAAEAPFKRLEH